jgi:hypothetical protein
MADLQRCFVTEFLASQVVWEDVRGEMIPRNKHLDWYLSSGAVQWHMQHAWVRPLVEDELALSWLSHTHEQVLACAVQAMPIEAQVELAGDLAQANGLENAARILHNVIQKREMPAAAMQLSANRLFSYVDRIAVSDRSTAVNKYNAMVAFKIYGHIDKASAEADIVFERLMAAMDQGASLDHLAMYVSRAVKML